MDESIVHYNLLMKVINSISSLSKEAMEEIMEMFTFQELKKGEYFVEEGSRSSEVAFIIEGVIRAFYRTSEGVEYNKTFFIENSFAVSLSAVLQKIESHLCFQTLTDCKLLVADYPKIENLFTKHRSIETIVRIILQNDWVIKKEQRELRFVLNNAEERYLYFQQEYPGLENRIPQYQIASHLGITPIQLSRIRANLSNTKK